MGDGVPCYGALEIVGLLLLLLQRTGSAWQKSIQYKQQINSSDKIC